MRLILALLFLACSHAFAQGFPNKPVRIIVPYPPGGGTDVVARTVAPKMQELLGQPVIVENRAGAGGNIGTEFVAKAPADGYTLLVASASTAINTTLTKNVPWHATKDFAPVVLLVLNQSLLVVHPSVPATNVRELIALAKSKPGQVTYASYGNGSSAHLIAELFKLMAGVNLLHIPYKGAAPAVNDILGGQVNVLFSDVAAILPHVKAGKVRALALGSEKRFAGLPDVPTIGESGVPGFVGGGFLGLVAPAGTPADAVNALNGAALKALVTPEVAERLNALASPPMGGTPESFGRLIASEVDKWARVIRDAKVTAD
jgi:tripartite-type tricarboxylate transporter receptor subunit TctC